MISTSPTISCDTLTRIAWSLRPSAETNLPAWKGSMLRGALGWGLSEIGQAAPAPDWPGLQTHTFAEALFDHQRAWNNPRAAAAWALRCTDTRTRYTPADLLCGELVCYGPWPGWALALFEDAWMRLADGGLGKAHTPFVLEGWTLDQTPPPRVEPERVGAIKIVSQSPCRPPKTDGATDRLCPTALTRGLLRRWRQLTRQLHGHDPLNEEEGRRLHEAAGHLDTLHHAATARDLHRHSSRQKRRHPIAVVEGTCTFAGPHLADLAPLWALAPDLHIGKQPHLGLGAVSVEWLPKVGV